MKELLSLHWNGCAVTSTLNEETTVDYVITVTLNEKNAVITS